MAAKDNKAPTLVVPKPRAATVLPTGMSELSSLPPEHLKAVNDRLRDDELINNIFENLEKEDEETRKRRDADVDRYVREIF